MFGRPIWTDLILQKPRTQKRYCPLDAIPTTKSEDCRFYRDGPNITVFETPSPYLNDMNCQNNITCDDSNQTVHFQIDFFDTERNYDYFVISRHRTFTIDRSK